MTIQLPVEEPKRVEEGKHNFIIESVEERIEPFHYIDVYYRLTDAVITIKEGYPAHISEVSKLGKLLSAAGTKMMVSTMIDLQSSLVGRVGTLMTINKKGSKGGIFAEVVEDSVRFN